MLLKHNSLKSRKKR